MSSLGWAFSKALLLPSLSPQRSSEDQPQPLRVLPLSAAHLLPHLENTDERSPSTLDSSPAHFILPPFPVLLEVRPWALHRTSLASEVYWLVPACKPVV